VTGTDGVSSMIKSPILNEFVKQHDDSFATW
jgi:hypothetical protein